MGDDGWKVVDARQALAEKQRGSFIFLLRVCTT